MNLRNRIDRRRSARGDRQLVVDREHLSPTVHRSEPVGRGPALEQLLDVLEPVFDGQLPPPVAVVGPQGSGTSALVFALFGALNDRLGDVDRSFGTTTRASPSEHVTWFAHVDGRRVDSEFAFYRAVLSVLSREPVPESGIGTDDLRERVERRLRGGRRAVVAIDHHDEPETLTYGRVRDLLESAGVADRVTAVPVGRQVPDDWDGATVSLPAYRSHELVDVITDRASTGMAAGGIDHESVRDLAEWADGNAHDALAALFVAAVAAEADGADRIADRHVDRGRADVPPDGVHLDRALALSENRQRVLAHLVALDEKRSTAGTPIGDLAAEIAARSSLTTGTVKRFLYELAERGVLERIRIESNGSGRNPSAVAPLVPATAFRQLTDASLEESPRSNDTDGSTEPRGSTDTAGS
ncbi:AAA family ATPase [Halobiforma lacisalsi AJ5]|uniref:AAA family ATPase n=1 Tax=Natronobacterium lacisalsi AJ5 TaxID=358396 RepID=M0LB61_NATLA|nr:ATP-binding protein [Halobiforma lacisalsi]APW97920.1 AAA family ATPase [Halobiforma lacisalsi AJ5]EMA29190.1 Cdc6-related protein AAA superfamily ATPase- like protein [Halobiforma lacisalsi AJ5]